MHNQKKSIIAKNLEQKLLSLNASIVKENTAIEILTTEINTLTKALLFTDENEARKQLQKYKQTQNYLQQNLATTQTEFDKLNQSLVEIKAKIASLQTQLTPQNYDLNELEKIQQEYLATKENLMPQIQKLHTRITTNHQIQQKLMKKSNYQMINNPFIAIYKHSTLQLQVQLPAKNASCLKLMYKCTISIEF